MKGSSKVIMGATMAIVIILAIVIALVLVLLAELYCSLLFRHRKLNKLTKTPSINSQPQLTPQDQSFPSPLSTFYAQGVLLAPRSFLFPKENNNNNNNNDDIEKLKHGKLHQFLRVQTHHQIGLTSLSSSPPSPSYVSLTKTHQPNHNNDQVQDKKLDFMYISNPIYDGVLSSGLGPSLVVAGTPFETPDGSPSWVDQSPNGSFGDDEEGEKPGPSSFGSLTLSTIKEAGEKACNSECNSHIERLSSSSGSLCNSPSW